MNRELAILELILIIVLFPFSGLLMLFGIRWIRQSHPRETLSSCSLFFSVLGVFVTVAGLILGFVFSYIAVIRVSEQEFFSAAGTLVATGFCFLVMFGGYKAARLARAIGIPVDRATDRSLNREIDGCNFLGWLFVLMPIGLFGPLGMIIAFPPGLLAATFFFGASSYRRGRQAQLLWLLAIAVERGIPLPDEIEAHATGLRWRARRRTLELAGRLRDGVPLAEALNDLPGLVPRYASLAVHVGSQTGTLGSALREAALQHASGMSDAKRPDQLSWLLIYFWFMLTVIQVLVLFQMRYIVPKLVMVYKDFGIELPLLTSKMISMSNAVVENIFVIAPFVAIPTAATVIAVMGYYIGWGDLSIPWLTRWFPRFETPWLLRYLALAVDARGPVSDSVKALIENHHRRDVVERLRRIQLVLDQGGDCWEAMYDEGLLKKRELAVVQSASRVGNLVWALRELASGIESRAHNRLMHLFETIRPLIVIAVGLVVAFICLGFLMPVVQLIREQSEF